MAWRLKVSQIQDGTPVPGTAGVARRDLWTDAEVTVEAIWVDEGDGESPPPGAHRLRFVMMDLPPDSASVFTPVGGTNLSFGTDSDGKAYYQGDDLFQVNFTPDQATYAYRVRLLVDGGGVSRTDTRIYVCRYDSGGTLMRRGWWFPAMNEEEGEANFADLAGNRSWLAAYENIFLDLLEWLS